MTLVTFQKDSVTGEVSAASAPGLLLQTDGVDNGDQAKLDLIAGTGITLTDDGVGGVTIDSTPGTTLLLQTDGVNNGDQTKLNLKAGTNVTLADDGVGGVTITAASSGGTVTHTGSLTADQVVVGNGTADVKILAGPADATKFLNGAAVPAFAQVKDSDLSLSNITTNDVSTSKHGFAPIAPNDASKFLDGTGVFSQPVPRAAGTSANLTAQSASIGATNLLASAAAGLYRISYYLNVTTVATTSSILLTLTWTDGSGTAQSFSTPAIVKNTVGYFISDSIVIESGAAQNIAYATTYVSNAAATMQYSLRVHLELI